MIDNYDSFTYNIVQYLGELGADVIVRRNDAIDVAGVRALHPAAVVISPGPCTPTEAGISLTLLREMAGELPILGVCLGLQCIGEAFGGRNGVTLALVFAVIMNGGAYFFSDKIALMSSGAQPISREQAPRRWSHSSNPL